MTVVFPGKERANVPSLENREVSNAGRTIESSWGMSDPGLVTQSEALRRKFVVHTMKWVPAVDEHERPYTDWDALDTDPNTLHVARFDPETGKLKVSLRLAAAESLPDSMSWLMLAKNEHANSDAGAMMRQIMESVDPIDGHSYFDEMNEAGKRGELKDLNRLVSDLEIKGKTGEEVMAEIEKVKGMLLETFSYALATTTGLKGEPRWGFLTTGTIKAVLEQMGIKHIVLASGKVSEGDKEDSYFCMVKPQEALDAILASRSGPDSAREHLKKGLDISLARQAFRAVA